MEAGQKFCRSVSERNLLAPGDRVLAAVSGGPDSVALLHLLHGLRGNFDLHLEVAHLQHGLRGEDAKGDARFVAELAAKLELPFHLKEIDLPRLRSRTGKGNLEALGRAERYRFFAEIAQKRGLTKVATAHTLDDQAETVLMWFLRGTGRRGLGGMAPLQEFSLPGDPPARFTLIRPLLEISKAEILEYLTSRKLAFRIDASNQDRALLRNWIRAELLAKIHERTDGGFAARLGRLTELWRDEEKLLEELARQRLDGVRAGADHLNRCALLGAPKALQRRVLRLWIEQARGHLRGIDFIHIDALLRLIEAGPAHGRLAIPGGWELVREYEKIRLLRPARRAQPVCYSYALAIGATVLVPEAAMEFHSALTSDPALPAGSESLEAVFDALALTGPLTVRNFRPGDRFQPLGMSGHKKIKDLFIEKKIALSMRARYPLLAAGEDILWIPGLGRSAIARVTERTAAVVAVRAVSVEARLA